MDRYLYSAIRVVPNPASGEYINMGVIAGSDQSGDWALRGLQDERRVRHFCSPEVITAAREFMTRVGVSMDFDAWAVDDDEFDLVIDPLERPAPSFDEDSLLELARKNRHVVQLSEPAPVLADSADAALDAVYSHLIVEPQSRRKKTLTKWRLISDLNLQYLYAGLEFRDHFSRAVSVVAGGPKSYRHGADFLVAEAMARQLVQTWSFQVASQDALSRDVKAWGWTIRELLEHGGVATTKHRKINVPHNVDIQVVIAPPEPGQPSVVYEEARSVFDELKIPVVGHGEESLVASKAADLLGLS
jgi:hypothetical protein